MRSLDLTELDAHFQDKIPAVRCTQTFELPARRDRVFDRDAGELDRARDDLRDGVDATPLTAQSPTGAAVGARVGANDGEEVVGCDVGVGQLRSQSRIPKRLEPIVS